MSRTGVIAIAVLVLVCSVFLAFRGRDPAYGAGLTGRQQAGITAAETTVALAADPTPAAETRFEVKNNWSTAGDPVALIVLGTMLLGLAAAVRRAV